LIKHWPSFARDFRLSRIGLWLASGALACLAASASSAATAIRVEGSAQREPELQSVVQQAINTTDCFSDQYDSAVWYKLMEPKLRRYLKSQEERLKLLNAVWCESRRAGQVPLQPGLVLSVIHVESAFDRFAVSSAGAVGVMQVMPFWPEQLGMRRKDLTDLAPSIRMGCAILRYYLKAERNDVHRALGRYNGSTRTRVYSDKVVERWTSLWNGADDLARASR
jgi:soluble lytic murein transglycosylase-like protein